MCEYIDRIVEVIQGYRNEDGVSIDYNHVERWLNQFDTEERLPLIRELSHILPKSYLSKEMVFTDLRETLQMMADQYEYHSVEEFINDTVFLSCQSEEKSQTEILGILNEVAEEYYGISVYGNTNASPSNWFYIDDVLATGGTFLKDFKNELKRYGINKYIADSIRTFCLFYFVHRWGYINKIKQIKYDSEAVYHSVNLWSLREINNHPDLRLNSEIDMFNHVYPNRTVLGVEFLNDMHLKIGVNYITRYESYAFRPNNIPAQETFYSSPSNRCRYEDIVLKKGIEIFNNIEHISAPSLRPLGMTNPSNKTLGTGSHAFTWRNISNTCPLIYWWETNGWYPLFPVKNRGLQNA